MCSIKYKHLAVVLFETHLVVVIPMRKRQDVLTNGLQLLISFLVPSALSLSSVTLYYLGPEL